MTLNMTLVTPWAVHQSADFRLTRLDHRGVGDFVPISNHAAKLVVVQYFDWRAFISYCGIGMWNDKHTYEMLAQWLRHDQSEQRTFEDVINAIQSEGTRWLIEIANATNKRHPHTFIICGFIDGIARVALISSFESLDVPIPVSTTALHVSTASIRNSRLIVTGLRSAVSQKQRMYLKALGKVPKDPEVVRHAMAQVNAGAAAALGSRQGISPSCLVYSCLPDGSGGGQCYGDVDGEMLPVFLNSGFSFLDMIKLNPAPGREIKMTGFSMASTSQLYADPIENCALEIIKPQPLHRRTANLELEQIPGLGGLYTRPTALNTLGQVIGESHISSGLPHAFEWTHDGGIQDLGTFGGPQSIANDINDHGAIVGSAQTLPHSNRAFIWTAKGMVDLGTLGGRDSEAKAINNSGWVVGNSYTVPGEPTSTDQRAFLWTQARGMINLGTIAGSWSQALDISDAGQVIGLSPVDGFTHAFLWTEEHGILDLGTLGGASCYAVSISNTGHIIGVSETKTREKHVFLWMHKDGMIDLGLPDGYGVRAMNDFDEMVLTRTVGARTLSFLWSREAGTLEIPRLKDHHTEVSDLNNVGLMIGRSWRGDYRHSHAILWK